MMTADQSEAFDRVTHIVNEENRLWRGEVKTRKEIRERVKAQQYYAQEWNLEVESSERLQFAVISSLEERGESMMWQLAQALGMTFGEANKFYMENVEGRTQ